MINANHAIPVSAADWYASQARIAALEAALGGLLEHCDADPEGETDFERHVIEARALLARVEQL